MLHHRLFRLPPTQFWHPPRLSPLTHPALRRRGFHASVHAPKDHHFDTLKFVQKLQDEGFSEEQSVALMQALSGVIEERYLHPPLFPNAFEEE